jgi:hypothetical protein
MLDTDVPGVIAWVKFDLATAVAGVASITPPTEDE